VRVVVSARRVRVDCQPYQRTCAGGSAAKVSRRPAAEAARGRAAPTEEARLPATVHWATATSTRRNALPAAGLRTAASSPPPPPLLPPPSPLRPPARSDRPAPRGMAARTCHRPAGVHARMQICTHACTHVCMRSRINAHVHMRTACMHSASACARSVALRERRRPRTLPMDALGAQTWEGQLGSAGRRGRGACTLHMSHAMRPRTLTHSSLSAPGPRPEFQRFALVRGFQLFFFRPRTASVWKGPGAMGRQRNGK
jgi:hypothetical protein